MLKIAVLNWAPVAHNEEEVVDRKAWNDNHTFHAYMGIVFLAMYYTRTTVMQFTNDITTAHIIQFTQSNTVVCMECFHGKCYKSLTMHKLLVSDVEIICMWYGAAC